ncbi:hypothetical protein DWX59_01415 [Enterocloster aldenensis]|nr:hypothetical protein DWX59_01415 [Enterocloster aldenensis]RGC56538.1 hypothetical protein DW690_22375 [Dorea longicatena]
MIKILINRNPLPQSPVQRFSGRGFLLFINFFIVFISVYVFLSIHPARHAAGPAIARPYTSSLYFPRFT